MVFPVPVGGKADSLGLFLMIWQAIFFNDETSMIFLYRIQNLRRRQETLEQHFPPFGGLLGGPEWRFRFRQDSASIYSSHSKKQWLWL